MFCQPSVHKFDLRLVVLVEATRWCPHRVRRKEAREAPIRGARTQEETAAQAKAPKESFVLAGGFGQLALQQQPMHIHKDFDILAGWHPVSITSWIVSSHYRCRSTVLVPGQLSLAIWE